MSVFMEYLEEAYQKELRNDQFKAYIKNLVELLLDNGFTQEEVLEEMPQEVQDYFHTNFARCRNSSCNEWNRVEDLSVSHHPSGDGYCVGCREDGN